MLKYSFISSSFELLPSCVPLYCFLLSRWLALQTCECVIDKPSAFPPYSNMFHVLQGEALPDTLNMDYPYNVSFKSLAYFLVAPTLCYQVAVLSSDLVNFWKQFFLIVVVLPHLDSPILHLHSLFQSQIAYRHNHVELLTHISLVWNMSEVFSQCLIGHAVGNPETEYEKRMLLVLITEY